MIRRYMSVQPSIAASQSELPPLGKLVVVQCNGFRCMAYRDANGRWRGAYDHKVLEVLAVLAEDAEGIITASA
jgi:hypothetical protein